MNIVRARFKSYDHVHSKYKCCPKARQQLRYLAARGRVWELYQEIRSAESNCLYCGHLHGDVKIMYAVGNEPNGAVNIELYDFDEGHHATTEKHATSQDQTL